MATVNGFTAARALEIEKGTVVSGKITGDNLILTKQDGTTITAGNVRGPIGPQGAQGTKGDTGSTGTSWYPVSNDLAALSALSPVPKVGDYLVNVDSISHDILNRSVAAGLICKIASSTTVTVEGSLRGPQGVKGYSIHAVTESISNVSDMDNAIPGDYFLQCAEDTTLDILGTTDVPYGGLIQSISATTSSYVSQLGGLQGPTGLKGDTGSGWHVVTGALSNISELTPEPKIGDYIVNTSSANQNMLGNTAVPPGGVVRVTASTAGTRTGAIQGPQGPQGNVGPQGPVGLTPQLSASSTTSIMLGGGTKTFALSPAMNVPFAIGAFVRIFYNPSAAYYMAGTVTASTTTSVTVNVIETGSGGGSTLADWNIALSGSKGAQGAQGNAAPIIPVVTSWAALSALGTTDGLEAYVSIDTPAAYGGPYLWHCRYNSALPSAKWQVVSAEALISRATSGFVQSTDTTVRVTGSPKILPPLPGVYRWEAKMLIAAAGAQAGAAYMWLAASATPGTVLLSSQVYHTFNAAVDRRLCLMDPVDEVQASSAERVIAYSSTNINQPFDVVNMVMTCTPIRLGT